MISSSFSNDFEVESQLRSLGYNPLGSKSLVKSTGRSYLYNLETTKGLLWIKHSYQLPPGEGAITGELQKRWYSYLPHLVYASTFTLVTETVSGEELTPTHSLSEWMGVANALGEIASGERSEVDSWLSLGVRDRRPAAWEPAVRALRKSTVVEALGEELLAQFDELLPDFLERYVDAFRLHPTLVPQDSGCCNIHVTEKGPIFYDWADIVIGHPVFSCDRLLDQTPDTYREKVIEAFCNPLNLSRREFSKMRRSNVLHEVLRYHDELAFLEETDPQYQTLAGAVQSQLRVLINHEIRKKTTVS